MTQTIWTVICKSEVGATIYAQDTASTTDRPTAVAWAQTELENDVTIIALEITGDEVRNVTNDITERAAKLTLADYAAKGFEADDMPDWVKATDAYDEFVGECEAGDNDWRVYERDVRKSYVAGAI